MATISRKLVLFVLMEKLVHHRFAVPYVINGITANVMKLNYLTLSLEKKMCFTGTDFVAGRFHINYLNVHIHKHIHI